MPDMASSSAGAGNRLAAETSPYLLQHARNPVDWYPWSEEALARARAEDRPILLSIGYSACHWCHVMEHESFENDEVARLMNDLFVCIKVDREERPDLDKIYQLAHQMLSRRAGGWPLTVFMAPDTLAPFFIGTYFPREARHGMPAFTEVLRRVADHFTTNRAQLGEHAEAIRQAFAQVERQAEVDSTTLTPALIGRAVRDLTRQYDRAYGGFGGAPKFPHPVNLELLARHAARADTDAESAERSLRMVRHTLHAMAAGGIYDHVGGGFCRYAVDERWMIPHFEKMLYDNALLLPIYADISVACGDPELARVARETAHWVMRDMQSADGGYYSSLDADSEGEEGRFYVWSAEAIRDLLEPVEWALISHHHGLNEGEPNFEGHWHLYVHTPLADAAEACELSATEARAVLEGAYRKLRDGREQRPWPGRDDKVLTSWNALMIRGMVRAGIVLGEPAFIDSGERAFAFIRERLWRDGRLLATVRGERAHLNAYLDDYAFLLQATLELLQARWRSEDLAFATALARCLKSHFEDSTGGFFFTSHDHERLLHRHKPAADDAIPSGNGIAALGLLRLGHLLGDSEWLDTAERTLRASASVMGEYPAAHATLACALDEYLDPTETVIMRLAESEASRWIAQAHTVFAPRRFALAIPNAVDDLPAALASRRPIGELTAYVCRGHVCHEPLTDEDTIRASLTAPVTRTGTITQLD